MAKIIAVYSIKGGVGKTSLAFNLAAVSAMCAGHRTLLWDLDAQGSASFLCDEKGHGRAAKAIFDREVPPAKLITASPWPKLDMLGADPSLRAVERLLLDAAKPKRLLKILQDLLPLYDRIILDCPPGLSELSDQVFKAADLLIAPVLPTPLGLRALDQMTSYLAERGGKGPDVMPVISMLDTRKSLHRAFLADHPDWPAIPQASSVEQMAVKRAPVQVFARTSRPAEVMRAIWDAVEGRLQVDAKAERKKALRGRPRIPSPSRSSRARDQLGEV